MKKKMGTLKGHEANHMESKTASGKMEGKVIPMMKSKKKMMPKKKKSGY